MTTSKGFLMSSSGLYGKRNSLSMDANPLADMAHNTKFPSWDSMIKHRVNEGSSKTARPNADLYDLDEKRSNRSKANDENSIPKPSHLFQYRERRCSDTAVLERKLEQTSLSPSHYKGSRRGTYSAVYDPRVSLARPRADTRSRSLFIKPDDETILRPDLRIQLLRSFHKHKEVSSGSDSECSVNSNDGISIDTIKPKKGHKIHRSLKLHKSPTMDFNTKRLSPPTGGVRQERALSSFQNLSKEHVEYLEKKYNKANARKSHDRNCDSSSTGSEDDELPPIHEATKKGDLDSLSELIDEGHDVNSLDNYGNMPCYYALLNGHFDCVALLVSRGANLQEYFARQKSKYFK